MNTLGHGSRTRYIDVMRKDRFYLAVGAQIKKLRDEHDLSLQELATRCGLSMGTLGAIECEGRSCSLFILALIAHELDTSLDDLVPVEALS